VFVVTKFGNLNFLEPFGALQSCNGTALPLPFLLIWKHRSKLRDLTCVLRSCLIHVAQPKSCMKRYY
jgi:hypothetical protein